MGQAVEVFQSPSHDQSPRWRGASQVFHRIVNFEHKGISQPAHLLEVSLGQDALFVGPMRLPRSDNRRTDQKQGDRCCDRQAEFVAPDELRGSIAKGVLARDDW